jgi:hypothetical protein
MGEPRSLSVPRLTAMSRANARARLLTQRTICAITATTRRRTTLLHASAREVRAPRRRPERSGPRARPKAASPVHLS